MKNTVCYLLCFCLLLSGCGSPMAYQMSQQPNAPMTPVMTMSLDSAVAKASSVKRGRVYVGSFTQKVMGAGSFDVPVEITVGADGRLGGLYDYRGSAPMHGVENHQRCVGAFSGTLVNGIVAAAGFGVSESVTVHGTMRGSWPWTVSGKVSNEDMFLTMTGSGGMSVMLKAYPKQGSEEPEKQDGRLLAGECEPDSVVADGVSRFTLNVRVSTVKGAPVPNAVVAVKSERNEIEPIGPYATDGRGQLAIKCRVREILNGKTGHKNEITISHTYGTGPDKKTITRKVNLELLPCQQVAIKVRNLANEPAPAMPVKYRIVKIPPGTLKMDWDLEIGKWNIALTDAKGNVGIGLPAGTEIEIYYDNWPYLRGVFKDIKCPAVVNILNVNPATAAAEIKRGYTAFLKSTGAPERYIKSLEAFEIRNGKSSLCYPTYMEIYMPDSSIKQAESALDDIGHELGHWVSMNMDKGKNTGGAHDIWKPCKDEVLAFEEAEAHFMAVNYMNSLGREYDDGKFSPQSAVREEVVKMKEGQGNDCEGSIAVFLNSYYSAGDAGVKPSPEAIVKDFRETMERNGKPIRTIEEFVSAKESQSSGIRLSKAKTRELAGKYKIKLK